MSVQSKNFTSAFAAGLACLQICLCAGGQKALAAGPGGAAGLKPNSLIAIAPDAHADDDKELRQQAQDYAKYYAARDAKALAAMWTTDGTFTDTRGREYKGRADLEEYFHNGFATASPQTLDVVVQSIKFPADSVAVEEGTTRISSGPGLGSMGRYLVVHTKVDGKWLMSTCAETDYTANSHSEYLKDLDWLVGSWSVKEQPQAAHLKVSWSKNKTFLICRYVSNEGNEPAVEEMQIIGWDAQGSQILVWHFGAHGGFGCGRLTCEGKIWTERASATESDGTSARAHYILTRLDDNTFTWQSSKRVISGLALPDTKALTITRDVIQ